MDIEELVRIQKNNREWSAPALFGSICEMLLQEQEILQLGSFLTGFATPYASDRFRTRNEKATSFLKAYSFTSNPSMLDALRDPKHDPKLSPKVFERLAMLVSYHIYDFDKVRKLPILRQKDFERAIKEYSPENFESHPPMVFRSLGLPYGFGERDETLVNTFGAVYEALNSKAAAEIDSVKRDSALDLFDKFSELAKLDPPERVRYAWALIVADEELKNALAIPVHNGDLGLMPMHTPQHISVLYRHLKDAGEENKRFEDLIPGYLERISSMEGTIARKHRDVERLEALLKERDAEIKRMKAETKDIDVSDVRGQLEKLVDDVNTWEALAHESERACDSMRQKLAQVRKYAAGLEAKLIQSSKKDANGNISNGTGITVYAGPEFRERYLGDLCSYVDFSVPDGQSFSDIIDGLIKHICRRIKDGGKEIALNEFDYMKQVKCHFYKKTDQPASGARIFFTTNFSDRLTVYDVITPEEHDDKLQSDVGRYKGIMNGRISYTFDEKAHTKLERSVRELFQK